MIEETKNANQDSTIKKEYTPPKLSRFGSIAELTSGGSQNANEGAGGQASRRP